MFNNYLLQRNGLGKPKLSDSAIKFFTAPINERVAMDAHSVADQQTYHAALNKHLDSKIEIISGHYDVSKNQARLVEGKKEPRDCQNVYIWKIEEKQSDVNVAVHAIYDALMDATIEQVVFVSNDTDILPAMIKLQEYRQVSQRDITIGLVIPRRDERTANTSLINAADWHISDITDSELEHSQLPNRINIGRKPSFKPYSWYEVPEMVQKIQDILKEAYGNMNEAYRWLDSVPKGYPKSLPQLKSTPFQEMNTEAGAARVMQHAQAVREYKLKKASR